MPKTQKLKNFLKGLINLKNLCLTNCKLRIIRFEFFNGLEQLEVLNLSWNRRIVLEDECFRSLNALKKLILSQCNISRLNEKSFAGLVNLEELDLCDNDNIQLEHIFLFWVEF